MKQPFHSRFTIPVAMMFALLAGPESTAWAQPGAPPMISDIPDQLAQMNAPLGPVSFTVGDADSPAESLTLSGQSTNPFLVAGTNIVFGGSGPNRTVTISPNPGAFGGTLITITVSDGSHTNIDTFVLLVNSPPRLTTNNRLTVDQGNTGVITPALLAGTDIESGPNQIVFTIGPVAGSGPPHAGFLRLNGTNLHSGDTFRQQDIADGMVTYQHDGSCEDRDDFQFDIRDADGGLIPTGEFRVYSFRMNITLLDRPPIALSGAASIGAGGVVNGVLPSTNGDCLNQPLSFRIVTNGTLGTAMLLDTNTGAFAYSHTSGMLGIDLITFTVSDGLHDATSPGAFSITITNTSPGALDGSGSTSEDTPLSATLNGIDPDHFPQPVVFQIVANGTNGTVVITDSGTGAFTYTPHPSAIGGDLFTFAVNDGDVTSMPATFRINIHPRLDPGDIIVVVKKETNVLLLVDPATGQQAPIAEGGFLSSISGLAVESSGTLLTLDEHNGLIRVNPVSGVQAVVASGIFGEPSGLAVEEDGNILVADGIKGVMRLHPVTGAILRTFSGGSLGFPVGVAIGPAGQIYVADPAGLAGAGTNKVVRLDPVTGMQTILSAGGNFVLPIALAVDRSGTVFVADPGDPENESVPGSVIRINPDGSQSLISTNGSVGKSFGIAVDACGSILVDNGPNNSITKVDPSNGASAAISAGGYLGRQFGLAVVNVFSIIAIRKVSATVTVSFRTQPCRLYELQYNSLLDTNWSALPGTVTGNGQIMTLQDPAATESQRFYRIGGD